MEISASDITVSFDIKMLSLKAPYEYIEIERKQ